MDTDIHLQGSDILRADHYDKGNTQRHEYGGTIIEINVVGKVVILTIRACYPSGIHAADTRCIIELRSNVVRRVAKSLLAATEQDRSAP